MKPDNKCECGKEELEDLLRQLPEPKHADYMFCPRCESTRGRWWGFRVRKDGTFVRRRMCHWCKKTYSGAMYRNVHREVSLAEAKRVLRNRKRFIEFADAVVDMKTPWCSRT